MKQLKSIKIQKDRTRQSLDESVSMILGIDESFTRKISRKKNDELISKADTAFLPDGVYILHETLGIKTVDGWNPEDNEGVVGILLIEDDQRIVVALEDSPKNLHWYTKRKLINKPIEKIEDAETDFNGEEYCNNLNSPDFFAAYYCLNYKKGNRSWYLPSISELSMIYRHLDEIQNALETVGGQKFATKWNSGVYWSSTEVSASCAWYLDIWYGYCAYCGDKRENFFKVRPVSKFGSSKTLKESFTRKISRKKNNELISKTGVETFIPDGVYILHDTLGVRTVDDWNPKNNTGVVGILLVEDDHKIVVATKDAPKKLLWSTKFKLNNEPICARDEAASDFNGEYYCQNLKDSDCFAVYYCLNYKKGGLSWYLPSSGELWMIYNHLEEIQNALETVGGQKFFTELSNGVYWSSTESNALSAWYLHLGYGNLNCIGKFLGEGNVRPVSKFGPSKTLKESFTRKIHSKKNDELISKTGVETFIPDGVYILHQTFGVRTVDGWNPEDNEGVTGILLIEDDHQIVMALEDAPEKLYWSTKCELNNEPIEKIEDAASDFNGEQHCLNLNSPDFPAAYYCLNYKKGGRNWYLPSSGELWLIYNHLEEIQNALLIVGGQKLRRSLFDGSLPRGHSIYWSSTECADFSAWDLDLHDKRLTGWNNKVNHRKKVRPVSKFEPSVLRESFTRKISRKKNNELIIKADTAFEIPVGVYILHDTLGIKTVDGWNPKDNEGVVGILLITDAHKIVVALEDSPKKLNWSSWSKKHELVNQPIKRADAASDFNGEYYCRKLNSPDFPAAYYCLNYKKGGRSWYLPSIGELLMIGNHFKEIQSALKVVGGKKFVTSRDEAFPEYWSSTEDNDKKAWESDLHLGDHKYWGDKALCRNNVRPVSAFSV